MDKLFSLSYWFGLTPGRWQGLGMLVLGIGLGMMILFIVGRILINKIKNATSKGVIKRLGNMFAIMGFLTIVYWFLRDQNVPFFSARFWLGLIALGILVWVVFIIKYSIKKLAREKELNEHAKVYDKYLPQQHK